jgi:nucleotide-binding universal stress UspA family protein
VVVREQYDPDATRVVVGVDGSANSQRGLLFAAEWAERVGAELLAVHTWRWLTLTDHPADGMLHSHAAAQEAARVRLAEAVAGIAGQYPDVPVTQEVVEGRAQRALCNRSHRAGLVVVGATGTGAFSGLLLGSVGSDVLHHARCPVAVVR